MISKEQTERDDPAFSKYDADWMRTNDDPISYALFRQPSKVRSLRLKPAWLKGAAGLLVPFIAGWIIWPYYTFYRLTVAFRSGDVGALEASVAWDSVRQGLRSELNAALRGYLDAPKEPGGALANGSAAALAPAMIDQVLEKFVTPDAIAASSSVRSDSRKEDDTSPARISQVIRSIGGARLDQIQHISFTAPFVFQVKVQVPYDPHLRNSSTLVLDWHYGWKLTHIILPNDALEVFVDASTQGALTSVTDNFLESSPVSSQKKKQDYIENLQVYDFKARYYNSLKGRIAGVEFTIKNNGTETLSMVQVTVYFKDTQGNTLSEQDYTPVLVSKFSFVGNNKPLKPNSIWQPQQGMFLPARSVPPEWKEGAAEIKITDIEFAGHAAVQ